MIEHALEPIKIPFLGVIDTVKAPTVGQYDIEQTPNVLQVRHALALLERRNLFAPARFSRLGVRGNSQVGTTTMLSESRDPDRKCVEAWFLGGHGDVGGGSAADGLALWPLQFLLGEAQEQGLVLGFRALRSIEIPNPIEYSIPSNLFQRVALKNGLTIGIWDISDQLENMEGMKPLARIAKLGLESERVVSDLSVGPVAEEFYTIIHPSVYYHDDVDGLGIVFINQLEGRHKIREFRNTMTLSWDEIFWKRDFRQAAHTEVQHTRILLCGAHGIAHAGQQHR
ncbi:hypothetical protein B0T25DRAFT_632953 [Lasiosphaeria hispida]|uniref:T6SS Phospholipase effector Tle1-like catalytic domain-containing protein n=1 Tax=Lasiosphaeria hispida TaxID=260671 RepID=A0AAJ0HER0_9PEZI|nr:hypothetical protein B0T25DRAFT_632953 [Lasiosphaeria hispida]